MNDIDHLKKAVRTFHEANIEFVLIGGLAMISHGANIVTQDVDFAYVIEAGNLERLCAFLPTIHARVLGRPANDRFVFTPSTLQKVRFLNLITDLGAVDIMREIAGVDSFEGLWERSIPMDWGGFVIRVASLDDLIAMKRAAGRTKDQSHLYELRALKKLSEDEPTGVI